MPFDIVATSLSWSFVEIGELHHGVDDGVVASRRDLVRVGEELEVLAHGDALVDAGVIGHVADDLAHRLRIDGDVEPVDLDAAGHRLEQRRHDADRRRLAGAVRADEAEDLARATSKLTSRRTSSLPKRCQRWRTRMAGFGATAADVAVRSGLAVVHGAPPSPTTRHEQPVALDATARVASSPLRRRRARASTTGTSSGHQSVESRLPRRSPTSASSCPRAAPSSSEPWRSGSRRARARRGPRGAGTARQVGVNSVRPLVDATVCAVRDRGEVGRAGRPVPQHDHVARARVPVSVRPRRRVPSLARERRSRPRAR